MPGMKSIKNMDKIFESAGKGEVIAIVVSWCKNVNPLC